MAKFLEIEFDASEFLPKDPGTEEGSMATDHSSSLAATTGPSSWSGEFSGGASSFPHSSSTAIVPMASRTVEPYNPYGANMSNMNLASMERSLSAFIRKMDDIDRRLSEHDQKIDEMLSLQRQILKALTAGSGQTSPLLLMNHQGPIDAVTSSMSQTFGPPGYQHGSTSQPYGYPDGYGKASTSGAFPSPQASQTYGTSAAVAEGGASAGLGRRAGTRSRRLR